MHRFTALVAAALASAPAFVYGQAPSNPVKGTAVWLGNVTSSNTLDGRDLGYSGQVGNCWINTFGDTFECQETEPQKGCNFAAIDARNSGGFLTSDNPLTYADIHFDSTTQRVTGLFVPHIGSETNTYGLGITNVLSTGTDTGIIYYLAGNGSYYPCGVTTCPYFIGAGWATITVDAGCDVQIDRPQINQWYGNTGPINETYYGDHGVIIAQDGMIYIYGSIPNVSGVGLARVSVADATNIASYEYWNGQSFQTDRIPNPTVDISVFDEGQGSIVWNAYYQKYLYIAADGYGDCIHIRSADLPQGPWSAPSDCVWTSDQQPNKISSTGGGGFMYTPTYQPLFSDPSGQSSVLWYTQSISGDSSYDGQGHQITNAINVTFTM